MHDIDDARRLILAEWRSCHPSPTDNLRIDLQIFIEGILATPSLLDFHCDGDRRQQIRDWVLSVENERRRDRQSQVEATTL